MKEQSKVQQTKESDNYEWSFNERYEEWRPSMPNESLRNRNCMRWNRK